MSLLAPAFSYQRRPQVDAQGNALPEDPPDQFPQEMTPTGADTPPPPPPPAPPMPAAAPPPPVDMQPRSMSDEAAAPYTPPPGATPTFMAQQKPQVPPPVSLKDRFLGHANPTPPPVSLSTNGAPQVPQAPAPRTPGILQRLGAAALGASTGYVNAARRTYIDPAQVKSAEQGILYPGYAAQQGAYQRGVDQMKTQASLNAESAKEKSELENAASWKQQREAKAHELEVDAATRAEAAKSKVDTATAARVDRLWKLQTTDRSVSTSALPGWQPAENPDGMTVYLSPATKKAPKELLEWLPGIAEGQEIPSREFDVAADAYRKSLQQTKAQENKPDAAAKENENQWIADAQSGDPAVAATAKAKLDALAKQRLAQRPVTNNTFSVPGLTPQAAGNPNRPHGEDYLATLPTGTAARVKAITEGREKMPPFGSRGASALLSDAVYQYDPNFSEQRAQVRHSFTAGPDGRNIGALNTATVHLDQLADAAAALKNGTFQPGNAAYNYLSRTFGKQAVSNFASLKNAVAGELAQALKGQATDTEIHNIAQAISDAQSPEQLTGAIETNLHVLGAKMNTYQERYSQQIPGDTAWSPILPSARSVFAKHGFDPTQQAAPQASGGGRGGASTKPATAADYLKSIGVK